MLSRCSKCDSEKDDDGFKQCSSCRERARNYQQKWRGKDSQQTKVRDRHYAFTKRYGVTEEAWLTMLVLQDSQCAICEVDFCEIPRKHIHIDHNHATGEVRKLLCQGCNQGLGNMKEDPVRLRAAANYLEMYV